MEDNKKLMEYDEDDSLKFIKEHLSDHIAAEVDDDDITYIVDLIYDYYDHIGLFDESAKEEMEIDEDELLEYVVKNVKKDKIKTYTDEQVEEIVLGELDYCDSINLFE